MSAADTLDRQAPIPYIRDKAKREFDVPTIKFEFEREVVKTVRKRTENEQGVPQGMITETSTYTKDVKVTLKTFSHSSEEDGEHFLEALETMQKELSPEWTVAQGRKGNDATVLFKAVDKMLLHSANGVKSANSMSSHTSPLQGRSHLKPLVCKLMQGSNKKPKIVCKS